LLTVGFQIVVFRDTTAVLAAAMAQILKRREIEGPPPLGPHIITGSNQPEWRNNMACALAEGRLSAIEVLARKPS